MITALTRNPHKSREYARHFSQYGIHTGLRIADPDDEYAAVMLLDNAGDVGSAVFREVSDIVVDGEVVNDVYRHPDMNGRAAQHRCRMQIWIGTETGVQEEIIEVSVQGRIRLPDVPSETAFAWDDVFVPDAHERFYHDTSRLSGKISARQIALDRLVAAHVPFRSNRAFKYGRRNVDGVVDLNHWPISPAAAIQFDTLPIDTLLINPVISASGVLDTDVGRMLISALGDGAHYRAARNRREWIYWAPGINAGIPLTPKEDPVAELIYLCHDFAHYASPDLIPSSSDDAFVNRCVVAHRMIGETMAMVTADMMVMEAFVHSSPDADAGKHGIYDVYAALADPRDDQRARFTKALRFAMKVLLKGDVDPRLPEPALSLTQRFFSKYSKFALADYEWTIENLRNVQARPSVLDNWHALLPEGTIEDLHLIRAKDFADRVCARAGSRDVTFNRILNAALDEILDTSVYPRMDTQTRPDRADVLTRSAQRYFAGQTLLFAAHPDIIARSRSLPLIRDVLNAETVSADAIERIRDAFSRDIDVMRAEHRITDLDADVYASVFPVAIPAYVSYANPNLRDHQHVIAAISDVFPIEKETSHDHDGL